MSVIDLNEAFHSEILGYYMEEVCQLACRIFTVTGAVVFESGVVDALPELTAEQVKELCTTPLPLDLKDARGMGIYGNEENLGYAIVAVRTEKDLPKADFFFQLLNEEVSFRIAQDDLEFDVNYLKYLIALMQKMSREIGVNVDAVKVADIFIKECKKIAAADHAAIFVKNDSKSAQAFVAASGYGSPITRFETFVKLLKDKKITKINNPARDPAILQAIASDADAAAPKKPAPPKNLVLSPLYNGDELIGGVYLADKVSGFSAEDENILQTLSTMLASTLTNIRLLHEAVANESMKKDLELAQKVQSMLLPETVVEIKSHNVVDFLQPATQCGGDWWGYKELELEGGGHTFLLMIGDVSGHGVPSALITAVTQGVFSVITNTLGTKLKEPPDPLWITQAFNRAVYESTHGELPMTFFTAVLTPCRSEIKCCNAAHTRSFIIGPSASEIRMIGNASTPLGYGEALKDHKLETYPWKKGQKLFCYTDGLIDCVKGDKNLFSARELRKAIAGNADKDAATLLQAVLDRRKTAGEGVEQLDDITAICCEVV
ncbi:MAG: SpoIIE family protein phosphatase [Deltaproteobacteria bacterium]|nr:SpoIIE family protein phosphatase [Deltaproteobacteria bacterium]